MNMVVEQNGDAVGRGYADARPRQMGQHAIDTFEYGFLFLLRQGKKLFVNNTDFRPVGLARQNNSPGRDVQH